MPPREFVAQSPRPLGSHFAVPQGMDTWPSCLNPCHRKCKTKPATASEKTRFVSHEMSFKLAAKQCQTSCGNVCWAAAAITLDEFPHDELFGPRGNFLQAASHGAPRVNISSMWVS
jgi:hypothetical protein